MPGKENITMNRRRLYRESRRLDRKLIHVLMDISDTLERIARHLRHLDFTKGERYGRPTGTGRETKGVQ